MSLNATLQLAYVKNEAPILNQHGAHVAINAQGCCLTHPDILLRRRKSFGRMEILHPECPRCKEERESTISLPRLASATTSVTSSTPKSRTVDTYIPTGDETFRPHGPLYMDGRSMPVVNVRGFPDAFNNDGRCIYHDEIQLRKPTWFGLGEMTVLRTECPTCKAMWREELDLMLRIQSCFE